METVTNMAAIKVKEGIPTKLTEYEFNSFIWPHLSASHVGRKLKISPYKYFSYMLKILYTGMQWKEMPIELDKNGKPEIHYTSIFKRFRIWSGDKSFSRIFDQSVCNLQSAGKIDASVLHGDGTSTIAKKGGDNLGYSGHKHFKGEKIVAIVDRNLNVISPYVTAPGNRNEIVLLKDSLVHLSRVVKKAGINIAGSIFSLDSGYDSVSNRKHIFNLKMKPNIKENKRNRKNKKRGRKRLYCESIYRERFSTVERVFAWEDKFKRLLIRFERNSINHFGFKLLAYTLINLRHFC
jgi:hypothetical protein